MKDHRDGLDYTEKAWDLFYDSVDDERFLKADAEVIYDALSARELLVSFGDYLKRYICEKAKLEQKEDEIPLSVFQQIIRDSFADRQTPHSFHRTTAKLSALSKNWLTQRSVKRDVVFLLGFGLGMSTEDVDEFLSKGIGERGINPKNPNEAICWFCYEQRYPFQKYRKLLEQFEACRPMAGAQKGNPAVVEDQTVLMRKNLSSIQDETSFLAYLSTLKTVDNRSLFSVTARAAFEKLYDQAVSTESDIVYCGYKLVTEKGERICSDFFPQQCGIQDALRRKAGLLLTATGPCWCMVKRDLLLQNELFFPEKMLYEDMAICPIFLYYAGRMSYAENTYYYYYQREDSTVHEVDSAFQVDEAKAILYLLEQMKTRGIAERYNSHHRDLHFYVGQAVYQ